MAKPERGARGPLAPDPGESGLAAQRAGEPNKGARGSMSNDVLQRLVCQETKTQAADRSRAELRRKQVRHRKACVRGVVQRAWLQEVATFRRTRRPTPCLIRQTGSPVCQAAASRRPV